MACIICLKSCEVYSPIVNYRRRIDRDVSYVAMSYSVICKDAWLIVANYF